MLLLASVFILVNDQQYGVGTAARKGVARDYAAQEAMARMGIST